MEQKRFDPPAGLTFDRCRPHSRTLLVVREEPLENLWGGQAKNKKKFAQGKKTIHAARKSPTPPPPE